MRAESVFRLSSLILLLLICVSVRVASSGPSQEKLTGSKDLPQIQSDEKVIVSAVDSDLASLIETEELRADLQSLQEVNQINLGQFQPYLLGN